VIFIIATKAQRLKGSQKTYCRNKIFGDPLLLGVFVAKKRLEYE